MSQSSLFSIVCCWACSPCSVFDASQLTRGWRWSKIEPWSLLSSTARIAREILLPGRAAISPSAGEVPCQKHPSKFCCAPRWCIHQQNALSVSTYGALYIYHPHLLCAPEEVSVPSYFASLGDLQSSPYKPAKDNKRRGVERRWKIWFHGAQCEIWRLHLVLCHDYEDCPFWTFTGNFYSVLCTFDFCMFWSKELTCLKLFHILWKGFKTSYSPKV